VSIAAAGSEVLVAVVSAQMLGEATAAESAVDAGARTALTGIALAQNGAAGRAPGGIARLRAKPAARFPTGTGTTVIASARITRVRSARRLIAPGLIGRRLIALGPHARLRIAPGLIGRRLIALGPHARLRIAPGLIGRRRIAPARIARPLIVRALIVRLRTAPTLIVRRRIAPARIARPLIVRALIVRLRTAPAPIARLRIAAAPIARLRMALLRTASVLLARLLIARLRTASGQIARLRTARVQIERGEARLGAIVHSRSGPATIASGATRPALLTRAARAIGCPGSRPRSRLISWIPLRAPS
jgi:hypothetical protein